MISKRVQWPIFKLPPVSHLPDPHINEKLQNVFGQKSFPDKLEHFDKHVGRLLLNDGICYYGSGIFSYLYKFYDPKNKKQKATYEGFRRKKFEELNEKFKNISFKDRINTVFTYDLIYNLEQNEILLDKDSKIVVEPSGSDQIIIFNGLIKEHLSKADEGGIEYNRYKNRVFSSDFNIKMFSQKLMEETTFKNKTDLIDNQVDALLKTFQYPNEYFTQQSFIELSDYFNITGIGANEADLFNFLVGNNKIDYSRHVIAVADHITILHISNIIIYYKWLIREKESIVDSTTKKPGPSNTKVKRTARIENQVIALFCSLLNESQLVKKEPEENTTKYCQRICKQFEFDYTDKVRQLFHSRHTNMNKEKLKQVILSKGTHPIYSRLLEYIQSQKDQK
jgi:hypothetical protein